ncbi:MAG: hypothetical protein WBZ36_16770, partial [Candidatus Nitrosopolaris sp.]
YGYSMTVGPDGKPRIREFGNVKPSRFGIGGFTKPEISGEIEPLNLNFQNMVCQGTIEIYCQQGVALCEYNHIHKLYDPATRLI